MGRNVLEVMQERGFVEWCSAPQELGHLFETETVTGYIGFDPTGDSLHVGHLVPIMGLAWLQRLGHRPIAIAGAGTGLIGDPSGKSRERNLLTLETVEQNLVGVRRQLEAFLDFDCGSTSAKIINNYDWLGKIGLLDFLRDVGKHFTVNYMLSREYVRSRIEDPEKSISYTEFGYMLLQAYDFYHLRMEENCRLQMGGNDQQGNIIAGIDLIRKKSGQDAYGVTYPLLLSASGTKFGKTEDGAVWLAPEKTSPYAFYQFWINADDRDVSKLLRLFTFLPLEEIVAVETEHARRPETREAQRILAWEVTKTVHGEAAAREARRASEILFGGQFAPEDLTMEMLRVLEREVPCSDVEKLSVPVTDVLAECGACGSKGEAKRLVRGGGVLLNGGRIADENALVDTAHVLHGGYLFFRLGKRRFHMVRVREKSKQ